MSIKRCVVPYDDQMNIVFEQVDNETIIFFAEQIVSNDEVKLDQKIEKINKILTQRVDKRRAIKLLQKENYEEMLNDVKEYVQTLLRVKSESEIKLIRQNREDLFTEISSNVFSWEPLQELKSIRFKLKLKLNFNMSTIQKLSDIEKDLKKVYLLGNTQQVKDFLQTSDAPTRITLLQIATQDFKNASQKYLILFDDAHLSELNRYNFEETKRFKNHFKRIARFIKTL